MEVKVVDFGIATKARNPQQLAGTLEFMAPELLLGGKPSIASDLYAVGVLEYALLMEPFPYSREHVARMILDVLGDDVQITIDTHVLARIEVFQQPVPAMNKRCKS